MRQLRNILNRQRLPVGHTRVIPLPRVPLTALIYPFPYHPILHIPLGPRVVIPRLVTRTCIPRSACRTPLRRICICHPELTVFGSLIRRGLRGVPLRHPPTMCVVAIPVTCCIPRLMRKGRGIGPREASRRGTAAVRLHLGLGVVQKRVEQPIQRGGLSARETCQVGVDGVPHRRAGGGTRAGRGY